MSLMPVALYGLEVPPGGTLVPAAIEFPATIRITMAAIDPTQPPETDSEGNVPSVPRATLKLIKTRGDVDEDDFDDEEAGDYLESLLANEEDDEEDEDEDDEEEEEANGGPSDPAKSKKARREAALKKLLEADEESDEDMEDAEAKANGIKKGKEKASDDDEDDEDDESDSDDGFDLEEYVLCTLDTERNYQQTLDITIGENERAFFLVTGTHAIHLTGNYVIPEDEEDDEEDSDDEDDYDLPPDFADVMDEDDSELSDELDAIERIEEIEEEDDEEEAPKLVKASESKKGKKRPADDEAEGLDDLIAKEEPKLSKKQQKKLKNNKGEAVAADAKAAKKDETKKVQFAKNLEQGPTGPAKDKKEGAAGVKVVNGVTIDDRKVGAGRTAKSGDKVGMRYIGKLENGKVFDSNKKGSPFSFKLGKGEVIKGWDIGVAGMAIGGERRLTIPAHLAYGSKALPGIPANSKLIFDVKLLEIK